MNASAIDKLSPQSGVAAARQDPYAGRAARQWWLAIALTLVANLAAVDRTILSLLFDPVRKDLGFSDTQMTLIYGMAFAAANVLFTLPAGFMADRVSRRGLIAIGVAVWSIMTSVCGTVHGFLQLFLARSGVGFAEGVMHPCSWSMLRSALPLERRGRGFAVYGMALMVGSALAFLLGGQLIRAMTETGITELPFIGPVKPWRLVMLALGFFGLPFMLLLLTVREPVRDTTAREQGTLSETLAYVRSQWKIYLPLVAFSATVSMQANAYAAFSAALPARLWGLSVQRIGFLLGISMLIAAPIGLWIVGLMMDRMTKLRGRRGPAIVGIVASFLIFITSTVAPLASTPTLYFTLMACVFLVGGTGFAIAGNILALITPARNMGKTAALQLFIYGLVGMGVGPAVTGAVSDTFFHTANGIAPALSLCCGVFTLTSFLCMCVLVRTIEPARK